MLNLANVVNINFDQLQDQVFDLGIFASGYEARSSALPKELNLNNIKNKLVLGFSEFKDELSRKKNDLFFSSNSIDINIISSREEKDLYNKLRSVFNDVKRQNTYEENEKLPEINVLLDYTSMSRLWYAGVLNFFRFQSDCQINVFLNYTLGKYDSSSISQFNYITYSSINSLPGHEGALSTNGKTLLTLAVGFSPYLIKSVIEEIEPNYIIGVLAIPNVKKEYERKSIQIKNDVLTKDVDDWVNCPIDDLEYIFRTYTEIANNNFYEKDIIFLSLGPKIFNLASILVSQRFKQVTCLYLKSSKSQLADIESTGHFICNKVTYKV